MKLEHEDGTVVLLGVGVDVGRKRWRRPKFASAVEELPDGRQVLRNVDVELAFAAAMQSFRPFVEGLAVRFADGDLDFAEELMQEAWIKLWELDPLRFDASDRGYVARALRNRIIDVVRSELGLDDEELEELSVRVHVRVA